MELKMNKNSSTFFDNMKLPIHRWFRYSAGFSGAWVESVVTNYLEISKNKDITILDPFAGAGTTLLACDYIGVKSIGFEAHPLVYKIAKNKLNWTISIEELTRRANQVLLMAREYCTKGNKINKYPDIVLKCYDSDNLKALDALRTIISSRSSDDIDKILWLAFICILRSSSHAGTASWQYVLPNKRKAKVYSAFDAFESQIKLMANDLEIFQNEAKASKALILEHDARNISSLDSNSIDLVITSPPYANNYDYADATRLELSVLGEIDSWADLQNKIRPALVRSCSQMVSKERKETFQYIKDPLLECIYDELYLACKSLEKERENHGGKKNYHTMAALYFLDLAKVWVELRRVCKDGAEVCFVVGDSAPYGIYLPVDKWLGELALSAGFKSYKFEKLRDRNIKWKNRKHRVPLKEGILWVKG